VAVFRIMAKTFRTYLPEQELLLPPSVQEWLPGDHLAYFVSDLVDQLDLSAIECVYEEEDRGQPPYHPRMMTKLLLYCYCVGVFSSRKIQKRLGGGCCVPGAGRGESAGLPHHLGFSEDASVGAGRIIPTDVTAHLLTSVQGHAAQLHRPGLQGRRRRSGCETRPRKCMGVRGWSKNQETLAAIRVGRCHRAVRPRQKPMRVIVDKAYDSDPLRKRLQQCGIELSCGSPKSKRWVTRECRRVCNCESIRVQQVSTDFAFQLLLHGFAYNLVNLFCLQLPQPWRSAQIETLRAQLFKIGARVRQTARCVRIHVASGWPFQNLFRSAAFAVNSS
jgi:Transposase DDE domain group 1/Transposase domain (DUF772)